MFFDTVIKLSCISMLNKPVLTVWFNLLLYLRFLIQLLNSVIFQCRTIKLENTCWLRLQNLICIHCSI